MKPVHRSLHHLAWAACAAIALINSAAALSFPGELIVYEPFDYPAGTPVGGKNGGVGWTAPWLPSGAPGPRIAPAAVTPTHIIANGSLAGPAGLPTLGNHAVISAVGSTDTTNVRRPFPEVAGADGTSLWISFLGQRVGQATDAPNSQWPNNPFPRSGNLGFFDDQARVDPTRRTERISIGNSTYAAYDEWSLIPEGLPLLRHGPTAHTPKQSELAWAVVRIDYSGNHLAPDDAWLWLNPDPLAGPPSKALADVTILNNHFDARDYSGIDFIRTFAGGDLGSMGQVPPASLRLDEIRIGTTWRAVKGFVPEPSSCGLLTMGALAIVSRQKRRDARHCRPSMPVRRTEGS